MGSGQSREIEPEVQEAVDKFVSKCLHRCEDNLYTRVVDVIDTASRMLPDIDTEVLKDALLFSVGTRYIRYDVIDDESVPDLIINHRLLDLASVSEVGDNFNNMSFDREEHQ